MDTIKEVKNVHTLKFENFRKKLETAFKKYEEDSKLLEARFQEEVAQYKIDLENFNNYYPNHGVRQPHIVRREMSAAKGEKRLELAREYRKAFRLWNKEPKQPTHPTNSAKEWLAEKLQKHKNRIKEKEAEMVLCIKADLKNLDKVAVGNQETSI